MDRQAPARSNHMLRLIDLAARGASSPRTTAPPPARGSSPAKYWPAAPLACLGAIALLLALTTGATAQSTSTAQEVATSIQRKYDSIRDFSADFVHTHEGGVLRRKREERGTLQVKKPGKMRWDYKNPDQKVFVSDGVRLIQYFPEENRAMVSAVPDDDQAAVLFLAGRGNLTRDFNVSFATGSDAATWTLRLDPKQPQPEYDWLEITAARDTLRLQTLTVAEKQGSRSTFQLTNFKENPGIADKVFAFAIPRGAEVTNAGPVKR
jgi:outer membrane lipoprotein carrier protein